MLVADECRAEETGDKFEIINATTCSSDKVACDLVSECIETLELDSCKGRRGQ